MRRVTERSLEALDGQARGQQRRYDAEYGRLPPQFAGWENWRLSFIKRNFQVLALQSGDRLLDIGVGGSGYTVLAAAQRGVRAIGTDISAIACRTASRYRDQLGLRGRAAFIPCSATQLPFPGGSFDKIVSNAVLEHVEDDEAAMDEIRRVSAPGARVLICVPNTYLTMAWPLALLSLVNDRHVGHLRHYAASDLAVRFGRRGFRVMDVTYHGHLVKLAQVGLAMLSPATRRRTSRLWWALERADLASKRDPSSGNVSLTLDRVF